MDFFVLFEFFQQKMRTNKILQILLATSSTLNLLSVDLMTALLDLQYLSEIHRLFFQFFLYLRLDNFVVSRGEDVLIVLKRRSIRSRPYLEIDLFFGESHLQSHVVLLFYYLWIALPISYGIENGLNLGFDCRWLTHFEVIADLTFRLPALLVAIFEKDGKVIIVSFEDW